MKDTKTTETIGKPNKPFALLYEEAEKTIFGAIVKASETIPFYMIEGIMTNYLHQVRGKAEAERDNARGLYDKQMEEYYESIKKEEEKEGEVCKKQ